jgi:hypothetical protein
MFECRKCESLGIICTEDSLKLCFLTLFRLTQVHVNNVEGISGTLIAPTNEPISQCPVVTGNATSEECAREIREKIAYVRSHIRLNGPYINPYY